MSCQTSARQPICSSGGSGFADYVGGSLYTTGSIKQRIGGFLDKAAFAAAPRTRFGTLGRVLSEGPAKRISISRYKRGSS